MPYVTDKPIADISDELIKAVSQLEAEDARETTEPKSREKLYQLPISGDWISLSQVMRIRAHAPRDEYPPDVIVICSRPTVFPGNDESHHRIICDTYEQACEIRDQIAKDRNAL